MHDILWSDAWWDLNLFLQLDFFISLWVFVSSTQRFLCELMNTRTHTQSSVLVNESTFSLPCRHRSRSISPLFAVIHRFCSPFVLNSNFRSSPETHYTHVITNLGTNITALTPAAHPSRPSGNMRTLNGLHFGSIVSLLVACICSSLDALLEPPGAVI